MENHPLVIGKSTISMGHFPVLQLANYQRVSRNSQQNQHFHGSNFVRDDPVKVIGSGNNRSSTCLEANGLGRQRFPGARRSIKEDTGPDLLTRHQEDQKSSTDLC